MPEKHHTAVLITDGNERSALAVTRSLGRRGIRVIVGAETRVSLAGSSKYCAESFVYPSPWQSPEEYIGSVLDRAHFYDTALVFPMTDLAIELLGGTPLSLPIPALDRYHALSDKYRLMRLAQDAGIPIPTTYFVQNGDISSVIHNIDQWPVVVKPGRSLIGGREGWKKTSVRYAHNADELGRFYNEAAELQEPSLIQSRIVGQGHGVFGLFVEGHAQALFAHRRLREKPPSGGVSVLRESIALPEPMTKYARTISEAVGWNGVAMVEFKVDRDSGVPYLMEVNGRFWGSLQLAIDAGIDFPWLLFQLVNTGTVPESQPYRIGMKSRWWLGDVDHLLLRIRKSEKELSLPPWSPSRLATLMNFLNVFDRKTKGEVLRLGDPRPGLHELRTYLQPLSARIGPAVSQRLSAARYAFSRTIGDVALRTGLHRKRINRTLSGRIFTILVLCKGNVCRSPFAARYLEKHAKARGVSLQILSAGLDTTADEPANPLAITASSKYWIDLHSHRTSMISKDFIDKADLILVMELVHNTMLFRMFPEARSKTFLLGHFSTRPFTDIRDPYGGTPEQFRQCYELIGQACDGLLDQLKSRRG